MELAHDAAEPANSMIPLPDLTRSPLSPALSVGIDVVDVRDVEDSVRQFGDRYLHRIFTQDEIGYCEQGPRTGVERFAARFAAKEATLKVLRPVDWWPDWRQIEVRRDATGWCDIRLHGTAAALADRSDLRILSCSLAHERAYATAVVLALETSDPRASHRLNPPTHA
jgi:holo-[acyl-carrier protein] synthase